MSRVAAVDAGDVGAAKVAHEALGRLHGAPASSDGGEVIRLPIGTRGEVPELWLRRRKQIRRVAHTPTESSGQRRGQRADLTVPELKLSLGSLRVADMAARHRRFRR